MRYRALSASGDYVFGSNTQFLSNTPAAVAQAIGTRLKLLAGEWFLDQREGLNTSKILGAHTQGTRDGEVKRRILETAGVTEITSYFSNTNPQRGFMVSATVNTIYGPTTITEVLQ